MLVKSIAFLLVGSVVGSNILSCSLIKVLYTTLELDHTTQRYSPPCSGSGRAVHRVILSRLSVSLEQLLVLCQDQEEQVGEE